MGKKAAAAAIATETMAMDARGLHQSVSKAFGQSQHELRRDGSAPLVFNGRKLAEATSYMAGTALWYELSAYSADDTFVASIKAFKKCAQEKDCFAVERFPTMSALIAHFEAYDPSHDITIRDDLTDSRLSAAEAMIKAAALRQRMAEARSEYRAASGELLTELSRLAI